MGDPGGKRMAAEGGFLQWLQGLHEGYTDAWANGVIGLENRALMATVPSATAGAWGAAIARERLAGRMGSADDFRASELGRHLQSLARSTGRTDADQMFDRVVNSINPDPAVAGQWNPEEAHKQFAAIRAIRDAAKEAGVMDEAAEMRLYEIAQNASNRRLQLMDLVGDKVPLNSVTGRAGKALASPEAAYLVPLTGAGLALLAAQKPEQEAPAQR